MKIIFLGTGTSIGVPAIGCDCAVCLSGDPLNRRRRASLYLETCGLNVIIDTAPDFREQVLAYNIKRLDAVLFTHAHVDHILGFDDIRRFNQVQKASIPVYGSAATLADLSRIFPYIHRPEKPGLSYPRVTLNAVSEQFVIGGLKVTPVPVRHADIPTYGYRLEAEGVSLAYVPDCQELDGKASTGLQNLDLMILDTLRRRPHPTHLNLSGSIAVLQKLGAKKSYLTHICHEIDHRQTNAELPPGISLAHDGLTLDL
jgi:phosphoribosyl 1,2-cyclic phosphate phosphodiesterase